MPKEQASEPPKRLENFTESDSNSNSVDEMIITKEMEAEEALLEKQSCEIEKSDKKKIAEETKKMDDLMRQKRYDQLQALLSKSHLYTSYLLKRMEKQRAEELVKEERKQKRLAKQNETAEANKVQAVAEAPTAAGRVSPSVAASAPGSPASQILSACGSTTSSPNVNESESKRGRKRTSISEYFTSGKENGSKKTRLTVSSAKSASVKNALTEVDKESTDNNANLVTKPAEEKGNETIANSDVSPKNEGGVNVDALNESDERIINGEAVLPDQPSLFDGGVLRKYQIDGFTWLKVLYENAINGILADEMGLGKTVQCIAMIAHLVEQGIMGPYLICAPLSTVPNWVAEFKRFTPKIPVVLYHGSIEERLRLRPQISRKRNVSRSIVTCPVIVTSYEIAMNDRRAIQNMQWKYIIVDEGHRIKNFQCRLIQELKLYQSTHRLLLTGTPLQNNLAELWSLLNFLVPEIFDNLETFESWFDMEYLSSLEGHEQIVEEERRSSILHMMHQILTPFMLRRLKADIEVFIPPKKELLVYTPLTTKQRDLYKSIVDKSIRQLVEVDQKVPDNVAVSERGRPMRKSRRSVDYKLYFDNGGDREDDVDNDKDDVEKWVLDVLDQQHQDDSKSKKVPKDGLVQRKIQLRNSLAMLRKCCNHPYLIEYPLTPSGNFRIDEALVQCSGKLALLDRMLSQMKTDGHKVLIFSQMTQMLDILQDYCYHRKYKFCRIDGAIGLAERREQIESFNTDKEVFIFLLSTRAGGLGINLTAADTVVIYDSDWNPQSDMQAQDRCHRFGQTRPVVVYRMVTAGTVDQKIVERAAQKRRLEKMIIHKGNFKQGIDKQGRLNTSVANITSAELLDLLRSTDYTAVQNQKDAVSDADLRRLLDRSDLYDILKQQHAGGIVQKTESVQSAKANSLFTVLQQDDTI